MRLQIEKGPESSYKETLIAWISALMLIALVWITLN